MPAADVFVTVDAGAEAGFGVVAVNYANIIEAERGAGLVEGSVETLGRSDVVASGEEMGGIEADAGKRTG